MPPGQFGQPRAGRVGAPMHHQQHEGSDQETAGDHRQIGELRFERVLEEQPKDHDRQRRADHQPHRPPVAPTKQTDQLGEVVGDDRHQGARMQDDGDKEVFVGILQPHQSLGDNEMARGTDRQKLSDALDDGEEDQLQEG